MRNYPNPYVKILDLSLKDQLFNYLIDHGFEISHPQYTIFQGKKEGIICTLFLSGKLVIQGKKAPELIEFFIEPELLCSFEEVKSFSSFVPHIGVDESGKGDFFGPLCIAAVYVETKQVEELESEGIMDSKKITDKEILRLAPFIKNRCPHQIVKINPLKYNEVYESFKNLNHLLAWGHATTIEHLVERTGCRNVLIDQFANESVVERALKRKKLTVDLTQRHRGEEDLAVAAASILAREAFILGLEQLGRELSIKLPKGCSSSVKTTAKEIIKIWGVDKLKGVCKHHFKTFNQVLP